MTADTATILSLQILLLSLANGIQEPIETIPPSGRNSRSLDIRISLNDLQKIPYPFDDLVVLGRVSRKAEPANIVYDLQKDVVQIRVLYAL